MKLISKQLKLSTSPFFFFPILQTSKCLLLLFNMFVNSNERLPSIFGDVKEEIKCVLVHGQNTLARMFSFCDPMRWSESLKNY